MFGWLVCFSVLLATVNLLPAQGTAFTYQGQLNAGGSPASGSYDLTFTLYNLTICLARSWPGRSPIPLWR